MHENLSIKLPHICLTCEKVYLEIQRINFIVKPYQTKHFWRALPNLHPFLLPSFASPFPTLHICVMFFFSTNNIFERANIYFFCHEIPKILRNVFFRAHEKREHEFEKKGHSFFYQKYIKYMSTKRFQLLQIKT